MPVLLWLALLLGYFVGVLAAVSFLPAPVVEPVSGRIAVASVVVLAGAALFALLQRRSTAPLMAGAASAERAPAPFEVPDQAASEAGDGERFDDVAGDVEALALLGQRLPDPLARAADGALGPRELRRILYDGRIEILGRPAIGLPGKELAFLHVVPRLCDGHGERLSPAQYARTAARCGLEAMVDRVFVIRALQTAAEGAEPGEAPVVACGIGTRSLVSPVFLDGLEEFLREGPGRAERLVLEFDHLPRHPAAAGAVRRLGRLGIRFALKRLSAAPLDLERVRALEIRFLHLAAPRFALLPEAAGVVPQLGALLAAVDQAGVTLVVDRADRRHASLLGERSWIAAPLPGMPHEEVREDAA